MNRRIVHFAVIAIAGVLAGGLAAVMSARTRTATEPPPASRTPNSAGELPREPQPGRKRARPPDKTATGARSCEVGDAIDVARSVAGGIVVGEPGVVLQGTVGDRAPIGEGGRFAFFAGDRALSDRNASLIVRLTDGATFWFTAGDPDPAASLPADWRTRHDLRLDVAAQARNRSVRVLWSDGSPAAGMTLWVQAGPRGTPRSGVIGADGVVLFPVPGAWDSFHVTDDDGKTVVTTQMASRPDDGVLRLDAEPPQEVRGLVVGPDGAPRGGFRLQIDTAGRPPTIAMVGADGTFAVKLRSGRYSIFIHDAPDVKLTPDGDVWRMAAEIGPKVGLRFLQPPDGPQWTSFSGTLNVAPVEVRRESPMCEVRVPRGVVLNGTWRYDDLPPTKGWQQLGPAREGAEIEVPCVRDVVLEGGDDDDRRAITGPSALLAVDVRQADGSVPPWVRVLLHDHIDAPGPMTPSLADRPVSRAPRDWRNLGHAVRGRDGLFRVRVPVTWPQIRRPGYTGPRDRGPTWLAVVTALGQTTIGPFDLAVETTNLRAEAKILPLDAHVGLLTDAAGAPLPGRTIEYVAAGAEVSLPKFRRTTTTTSDGYFVVVEHAGASFDLWLPSFERGDDGVVTHRVRLLARNFAAKVQPGPPTVVRVPE